MPGHATEQRTEFELNVPQNQFLQLEKKFGAYVAGFGSGKTFVGCASLCKHAYQFPKVPQGYFAPTYRDIRDTFYPTITEVAEKLKLKTIIKSGDKEVELYSGRKLRSLIKCRSMDDPGNIVGFKVGNALVDELDILPTHKAELAWKKIIARLRFAQEGVKNGAQVTTTPEGFKFVYNMFVKMLRDKPQLQGRYAIVQASTYDNEANLNEDYIDSLLDVYPEQLIAAYLDGQFVNLKTGNVYAAYDRNLNHNSESVQEKEPVYIGMDFNVGKMAAIVHVKRRSKPCAVAELMDGFDTPDMIEKIKSEYWEYKKGDYVKTREITIFPDASGDSRKTVGASKTDIALLKNAGFSVKAPKANPPVKDRINSMNAMFRNARGERRYTVNDDLCPRYSECLEQQGWDDSGNPDKSGGHDHANDAGGYYIQSEFPIIKPINDMQIRFAT